MLARPSGVFIFACQHVLRQPQLHFASSLCTAAYRLTSNQPGGFGRVSNALQQRLDHSSMSSTNSDISLDHHVQIVTRSLESKGQLPKKQWWEKYMKHVISFYGVPMADIRSSVKEWVTAEDASETLQRETAWLLFQQPIAEQKLAAILLFQNHVDMTVDDLRALETMFHQNHIYDWNTTDWLCVRVLGPLITREGQRATRVLQQWVQDTDNPLWQRRAALVGFVNITKDHCDTVLEIAAVLAQDSERFAQTAIGWTLRNLSKTHTNEVVKFLKQHKAMLGSEAINMASAKMSDKHRNQVGITGKRKQR